MNESIVPVTPGLLALLSGEGELPKAFTQEIFLLSVVVAGTTHCENIEELEPQIEEETVLTMKREPNNEFDEFAIALYLEKTRIGYVPADMNVVCSRLMDAGKMFFCRVVRKKWKGSWLKIIANIYMVE